MKIFSYISITLIFFSCNYIPFAAIVLKYLTVECHDWSQSIYYVFKHVELTQLDFSNSSDMTDVLVGYVYYLYKAYIVPLE